MKKCFLISAVLIATVLSCNALTITEKIILSKFCETTPISSIGEISSSLPSGNYNNFKSKELDGISRFILKSLASIGKALAKELCGLNKKPYNRNSSALSYAKNYNTSNIIRITPPRP